MYVRIAKIWRRLALPLTGLLLALAAGPAAAVSVTVHTDPGGIGYYDIANPGGAGLYAIAIANDSATYADDIGTRTWLGTVVSLFEWDAGFGFFGADLAGWTIPDTTDTFATYFGTSGSQLTVYWVADDGFGTVGTPIGGGEAYVSSLRFLGDVTADAPYVVFGQDGAVVTQGVVVIDAVPIPATVWLFASGLAVLSGFRRGHVETEDNSRTCAHNAAS